MNPKVFLIYAAITAATVVGASATDELAVHRSIDPAGHTRSRGVGTLRPRRILIRVSTAAQLHRLFSKPRKNIDVRLKPGVYDLTPTPAVDSTCGNCEDPATPVSVTLGIRVSGNNIRFRGPRDHSAVIRTHAGYGILVDGCYDCIIEDLSITDGVRDADGNATDAAIVVKHSKVTIRRNAIFDNIGDSTTVNELVVGIAGIAAREGAIVRIIGNVIRRNSWDGIALYRGARAVIKHNVIDGVDKARGKQVGGGRGVGIGVTWDARATIEDNFVTRYWKGIGLFVDARAQVKGNIVEDVLTWGITLWDAGKGAPSGVIADNVIYNTGACGVAITRASRAGDPGRFVRNIVVETGQNRKYDDPGFYCFQCALALHAVPDNFEIWDNVFFNNRRASEDLPDYDVGEKEFRKRIRVRCAKLAAKPAMKDSKFLKRFDSARRRNRR